MKKLLILSLSFFIVAAGCSKKDMNSDGSDTDSPSVTVIEEGLITWSPDFPTDNEAVTLTFDPSKGDAGLNGYTGDVYMYAGVITDKSTSPGDWKYIKSNSFNAADPASKMAVSNSKFQISFTPRTFFNVPVAEKILKIAMVFRNADGSKTGRNKDKSDIYMPVFESQKLAVRFTAPELLPLFTPSPAVSAKMIGDEITVSGVSSNNANLTLSLNGTVFANATGKKSISGKVKLTTNGSQVIKLTAADGTSSVETTMNLTVNGTVEVAALPAGARDGVTMLNGGTSAIFNLYAPGKQYVYLIGDFNNWQADTKQFMKKTPDGNNWWVQVDNLDPNKQYSYQYFIDGALKVADPYCQEVLDPQFDSGIPGSDYPNLKIYPTGKTTGIVSITPANGSPYIWKNANFTRPAKNSLVIYELHLRDFLGSHNYSSLKDTLNYLSNLGVNAIELMPVTEFEGNSSWGYNPSFYFAPDKYYGTKTSLQAFVDECHERGIAVIMDMVLNHSFGQSPMVQLYFDQANNRPAANNPWFNTEAKHPYNVGYDFNHESAATKYFVKNVLKFWMQEYKIDGFRFDLSKGFTQNNTGTSDAGVNSWSAYDVGRVAIWKDYNDYIKSVDANNFYVILEHFAADQEEQELARQGMMLWNNLNYNFNQSTMGYIEGADISRGIFETHGFTDASGMITYMESHDEERLMFKNLKYGNSAGSYSVKDLKTALNRQAMAAAFLFSMPGPKMFWEFGELGYDVSIDENGRTGEKPIKWSYNTDPDRRALYNTWAKLVKLKIANPIFSSGSVDYSLQGLVKYLKLSSASNQVIVAGNFDVSAKPVSVNVSQSGTWHDAISGNDITISGNTYSAVLAPGEYHIYSTSVLK